MASTVSGTQNTVLRSLYEQLITQLRASGGSPIWTVDDFIEAAGRVGIAQAQAQMGSSGVGWDYGAGTIPGPGGRATPTPGPTGTSGPQGGTIPGPTGDTGGLGGGQFGGYSGPTAQEISYGLPPNTQWLNRLRGLGQFGAGPVGVNPVQEFARGQSGQMANLWRLSNFARTGRGQDLQGFGAWQPGATAAGRAATAQQQWGQLQADPTGDWIGFQQNEPEAVYDMFLQQQNLGAFPWLQRFRQGLQPRIQQEYEAALPEAGAQAPSLASFLETYGR